MCTRMEIHNTQLTVFFKCQKIVQNSHKLSEIHGCIYALYICLYLYIYMAKIAKK